MMVSKKSLHVRISPIFHDILDQEIHAEFIKGNIVKKNEMVEKAILSLVAADILTASNIKRLLDWYGVCEVEGQYDSNSDLSLKNSLENLLELLQKP